MHHTNVPYAELTEKELQKLMEAEKFINNQPDHQNDRGEGQEIILLAYTVKNDELS
jgi:hypothetical protein